MPGLIAFKPAASMAYGSGLAAAARVLFPPRHTTTEAASHELRQTISRDPRTLGQSCTRWTLAAIRHVCAWVRVCSDAGMYRILKRCRISWQRARSYVHSPDRDYAIKLAGV